MLFLLFGGNIQTLFSNSSKRLNIENILDVKFRSTHFSQILAVKSCRMLIKQHCRAHAIAMHFYKVSEHVVFISLRAPT